MQDNPFGHLLPRAPQQPAQPRQQTFNADPIVAPAPPSERRAERDQQLQEARFGQQAQVDQQRLALDAAKAQREAIEFQQKQAKQEAGIPRDMDDVRAELLGVIGKAGQARRKSNEWFATGFGADVAGNFSGTSARDVQGLLDSIGGNIAFDRLSRMRAESPTGGALGNVTERELTLLQSTVASLDKAQSDVQFQAAMDDVIRSYGRVLAKIPGTDPNAVLQQMLEGGASKAELLALADGMDLELNEAALDANIRSRDETGAVGSFVPGGGPSGGGGGGLPTPAQFGEGIAQGAGDIVQGIGDTVGIVTDPFARVLSDALGYDSSQFQSLGTVTREQTGLPQSPEGIGRSVNQFAAGALAGGGLARGASTLFNPGTTQSVLSTLGRTPIRDTIAGGGAGAGAEIGQQIGGTPGQVVGILAGGLSANAAANRLANVAAGSAPNALAQAAGRQRVDLLPADAGGPIARAVTTGTRASPLSVAPVTAAAERQQQQFGDAVRRTAASQGEVLDTQAAGETVQAGAREFSKETAARGGRLYDRAAEQARGVRAIKPTRTVQAVDEAIARMRDNPAAAPGDIASLEAFRDNIANGVSIQGLRDARTTLSQGVYDGKLRSGADQAMWKGILGNVADDIDAGLRSVGRGEAANTFRAADKFWKQRVETIDQTLAPIVGKDGQKGGEQVLQAIESMARGQGGGNMRLNRLLSALPEAEAGNVRATLIDRLGRSTPGAQDAQGQAFSASTFLTNWNRMTPQAKASMFPDKGARANLNDLATIAEQTKRSQAMANTSNTGVAIGANAALATGGAVTNLPATLVSAGSIYLTGKLMASPQFARILARTSKMPPAAANRTFREQLGVLSTRQPGLAGDIEALTRAVNDNPASSLAAEQQQNEPN